MGYDAAEAALKRKIEELGQHARILINLHLEKPQEFDAELILSRLIDRYEHLELDLIDTE